MLLPAHRCVFQRPDDRNFIGVELSKDLGEYLVPASGRQFKGARQAALAPAGC